MSEIAPHATPVDPAVAAEKNEAAAKPRLSAAERKQAARERWMQRIKPEVAELLFSNPDVADPGANEQIIQKLVVEHKCSERMLRALCNIGQSKYKRLRKALPEEEAGSTWFYNLQDRSHFETFIGAYIDVFFEKKDVPFVSWASVHRKYNAAREEEGLKPMSYSAFVRFRRMCFNDIKSLNLKRGHSDVGAGALVRDGAAADGANAEVGGNNAEYPRPTHDDTDSEDDAKA
jgi:hypothetical protein